MSLRDRTRLSGPFL